MGPVPRCLSDWPQHGVLGAAAARGQGKPSHHLSPGSGALQGQQQQPLHQLALQPSPNGSGLSPGRCFRAPSGLSDDDEADDEEHSSAPTRRRENRAFSAPDDIDSDCDEDEQNRAALWGGKPQSGIRRLSAAEVALQEWTQEQIQQAQVESRAVWLYLSPSNEIDGPGDLWLFLLHALVSHDFRPPFLPSFLPAFLPVFFLCFLVCLPLSYCAVVAVTCQTPLSPCIADWHTAEEAPQLPVYAVYNVPSPCCAHPATSQLVSRERDVSLQWELMQSLQEYEKETLQMYAELQAKHEALLRRDADKERQQSLARQQKLSDEQMRQQKKLQLRAEELRRAEELERQRQIEKQRREEEERAEAQRREQQRLEEEKKKQQQQQAKQSASAQAKAAADAKAAEAAKAEASRKTAKKAEPKAITEGGFSVRISASACEWQRQCAEKLSEAEKTTAAYVADTSVEAKKHRRTLDKEVTKYVVQISAVKEQIMAKAGIDIVQMVKSKCADDVQRTFVLQTLATKLMKQCEVQVAMSNEFAFALAEVAVHIMAAFPMFEGILMGTLHKACILAVPKYYIYKSGGGSDDDYFRKMGYKETPEEERQQKGRWESTDDFLFRSLGFIYLYAAIVQVDVAQHPHGLERGWEYLARLLNSLPSNRTTSTALHAFLKVCGYKMYHIYGKQFMKLLEYVQEFFLPDLNKSTDPDARAVHSRLHLFIDGREYMKSPVGREI
eukprot:CAMPEP_0117653256 /NCGR_PEP_ID=MMETSP0804-20121206/3088_1 /TAXON_ID=1074897 /ORGANISM="Tetraselmis astigmatica, Strain CCMP880" /LENGTH=724 /DNA_ID=CAMNT_0005459407 /DNA_START=286 /DNA_END=2460 /DNA_ORIENTATION=+